MFKKTLNVFIFSVTTFIAVTNLYAQDQHKIDSLQTILASYPDDRQKVDVLTTLSGLFYIHNNNKAIQYGEKALALAEKIDYIEGKAEAHYRIGWCYLNKDNYPKVHKHQNSAIQIFRETKNHIRLFNSYECISSAYNAQDNYPASLTTLYEARKIAEVIKDSMLLKSVNRNIKNYLEEKNTPLEELKSRKQDLEIYTKSGDKKKRQLAVYNIGQLQLELENYSEALKNGFLVLQEAKEIDNSFRVAKSLYLLGRIYKSQKKYTEAIDYFAQTLEIAHRKNFKKLELETWNQKGEILFLIGKNKEAKECFAKSLVIAKEVGNNIGMSSAYRNLSQVDSDQGNFKSSLHNFKLHIKYRDSIYNKENTKKILKEEFKYENEKLAAAKKVKQENREKIMLVLGVFILLLFLLLFNVFKNKLQRRKLITQVKKQTKKIRKQKDKLQESDLAKSRLYTNITHEFRTPLTIISGISEQLTGNTESKSLIKRNSDQLLNLVNQMLDLQELESGEISIHKKQGDIIKFIHYLTESLKSYADLKGLTLHFLADNKNLLMDFDAEKITRIHSNLLSNAIKFTPKGGDIYVQLDVTENNLNKHLIMKIKDTGVGISEKELPLIFKRFYQVDDSTTRKGEGTGIGLTLVSELTNAMKGKINVSSIEGKGTTFSIILPITNIAEFEKEAFEEIVNIPIIDVSATIFQTNEALKYNSKASERPTVLIVEDNADVIHYLISCLKNTYTIEIAMDGEEGVEKAITDTPNIIVSDVMMPIKDGFELCQTLKTDERTSHIPIILLTAKANIESRLEGLQRGADAYLSKPFHQDELLITLQSQLALRKKLQRRFSQFSDQELLEKATSVIDKQKIEIELEVEDAFLQKIKDIIEKDLTNTEIGMPQLVRTLGMSRSQIYKKVKALTGKSPSLYMRSVRLYHAQELLKNNDFNISEVAYKVGFSSPVYFSDVFLEEFGARPNETRK